MNPSYPLKTLLLTLLSFSSPDTRPSPFSFQKERKLRLSDSDFKNQVIPELKNIERDFFSLFRPLNPLYPSLLKEKKNFFLITQNSLSPVSVCRGKTQECEETLGRLYRALLRFELSLVGPFAPEGKALGLFMEKRPRTSLLWFERALDLHGDIVETATHVQKILYAHDPSPLRSFSGEWPSVLRSLELKYELFFFSLLSEKERVPFSQVYRSFVSPLSRYVVEGRSKEYLKQNIEALNFAWNDFHMRISKTNRVLPKKTLSKAKQIHQRWVMILRLLLRR
ncbi:MAG: hypothetical protein OXB88_05400 [Bacteriovoracales bacterium]|nr:hypothetical protein [Bacteriovoracales bacterium]